MWNQSVAVMASSAEESTTLTWINLIAEWLNNQLVNILDLILKLFGDSPTGSSNSTRDSSHLIEGTYKTLGEETLIDTCSDIAIYILSSLSFDSFQWQLLKVFLLILMTCAILIYATWHIYGPGITQRFMHPNSSTSSK